MTAPTLIWGSQLPAVASSTARSRAATVSKRTLPQRSHFTSRGLADPAPPPPPPHRRSGGTARRIRTHQERTWPQRHMISTLTLSAALKTWPPLETMDEGLGVVAEHSRAAWPRQSLTRSMGLHRRASPVWGFPTPVFAGVRLQRVPRRSLARRRRGCHLPQRRSPLGASVAGRRARLEKPAAARRKCSYRAGRGPQVVGDLPSVAVGGLVDSSPPTGAGTPGSITRLRRVVLGG